MTSIIDKDKLISLSHEARELYLPKKIPRLSTPPSPIVFLRNYVMPNIPVLIENGVCHWPALKKWTNEYLCKLLGDKKVTVSITPNGYADATVGDKFVLPDEEEMKFQQFITKLEKNNTQDEVVYIQNQNSSFLEEFSELLPDAAKDIPWASEAFGKQPDAVNFWMGSEHSVTSMHKDHYENLYAVIKGSKTFILYPPTDLTVIPYENYQICRYTKNKFGKYVITEELSREHCQYCINKESNMSNGEKDLDEVASQISKLISNDNNSLLQNDLELDNKNGSIYDQEITIMTRSKDNEYGESIVNHITENDMLNNALNGIALNNFHDSLETNVELESKNGNIGTKEITDMKINEIDYIFRNNCDSQIIENDLLHCTCTCHSASSVPWVAIDPLSPDYEKYPLFKHANRLHVTVNVGDLLYLPSLWFHHVQQSKETIAVNFWYDMEYDIKYNYFKFVESLLPGD